MDEDETLTAYHESGHAVVGYALGGRIDSIQLGGEADDRLPERFGDCRIAWERTDPRISWQRQREVLTILAGPVTEMIYRQESWHPADYGPWQHDWHCAESISESLIADPNMRSQLLESLIRDLHRQIQTEPYWPAIATLADELLVHQFMETEQIEEVLEFWFHRMQ